MAHFYVKVTKAVADSLGVTSYRNKTADGNYLLCQSDIRCVPCRYIEEQIAYVGGAKLSPTEARNELDGVPNPAHCYTPVAYGGAGDVNNAPIEDTIDAPTEEPIEEQAVDEPTEAEQTESETDVEPVTNEENE